MMKGCKFHASAVAWTDVHASTPCGLQAWFSGPPVGWLRRKCPTTSFRYVYDVAIRRLLRRLTATARMKRPLESGGVPGCAQLRSFYKVNMFWKTHRTSERDAVGIAPRIFVPPFSKEKRMDFPAPGAAADSVAPRGFFRNGLEADARLPVL